MYASGSVVWVTIERKKVTDFVTYLLEFRAWWTLSSIYTRGIPPTRGGIVVRKDFTHGRKLNIPRIPRRRWIDERKTTRIRSYTRNMHTFHLVGKLEKERVKIILLGQASWGVQSISDFRPDKRFHLGFVGLNEAKFEYRWERRWRDRKNQCKSLGTPMTGTDPLV